MATEYYRVSLQGTLPGGEVFSINPAFQGDFDTTVPTQAQLQAWADDMVGDVTGIVGTTMRTFLSTAAAVTAFRVAYYGADGLLGDYAVAQLTTPFPGTGNLRLPPTSAAAMSLYTATQTRRGRGRVFWPAMGATLDVDSGRFTSGQTGLLAADAVSMLGAMQDAAPVSLGVIPTVFSKVSGGVHPVTQVRVGDVPDSQRGRKDALSDVYAIRAYP